MNALPTDPEARQILAAEYVLGTLDAKTARAVAAALAKDDELADLVAEFEAKLMPMAKLAIPEAAPPDLWNRIEASIAAQRPATSASKVPAGPSSRRFGWGTGRILWQGWAIAATLVAIVLGANELQAPTQDSSMTTVLVADAQQSAWVAQVDRSGGIRLAAIGTPAGGPAYKAPSERDLQLWALAPGATKPVSLGLVPHDQSAVKIARPALRPEPGMTIMISVEPLGGAPGALPTGPVVFLGRLVPVSEL